MGFLSSQAQSEYDKSFISIGVVVSDLEASLGFYKDIIGMVETGEFSVDETISKTSGLTGGQPFHVKVLKLMDEPGAAEYKLMSFGNDLGKADQHIQDQNGMQYITLFIKSTSDVLKRLKDNNIKLLGETPILLPRW